MAMTLDPLNWTAFEEAAELGAQIKTSQYITVGKVMATWGTMSKKE
jgi:hypothetical protein